MMTHTFDSSRGRQIPKFEVSLVYTMRCQNKNKVKMDVCVCMCTNHTTMQEARRGHWIL